MYIPKRYGQSKLDPCPFCKKASITKNSQGVPVCLAHKEAALPEMKCACGNYLNMMEGKFGVFFNCMSCGNKSLSKVLSMNPSVEFKQTIPQKQIYQKTENKNKGTQKPSQKEKKEVTVTSDQVDVYFS